jgi:hypothetical protein
MYAVLLVCSVAVFVTWGGPLWTVTHADSHVMRFVASYFGVVPLVVATLAITKRLTWTHVLTAVGTIWAIKLLLTAPLYYALAPGGALEDIGAIAPTRGATSSETASETKEAERYVAAEGGLASGVLSGTVTNGDGPAVGAVVYLDAPRPGRPLAAGHELTMIMTDEGYAQAIYLATTEDRIIVRNDGTAMNNAKVRSSTNSLFNAPLPPGAASRPVALEDAGLYTIQSDIAVKLHASLLVTDHPYAVAVDAEGHFKLPQVPSGAAKIIALWANAAGATTRADGTVEVNPGGITVDILVGGDSPKITIRETK